MTISWVLGSGGLLGSSIVKRLEEQNEKIYKPDFKFTWNNNIQLKDELTKACNNFANVANKNNWKIYWAAGSAYMNSSEIQLKTENNILNYFVKLIKNNKILCINTGIFIYASSAGSIYSNVKENVITELTLPDPQNNYGKNKIIQEEIVSNLVKYKTNVRVLICRITNIYGFRKEKNKNQGLISELAKKILRNQVINIYVPLQTARDYIDVETCSKIIIESTQLLNDERKFITKIVASENSVTIAYILSILKNITKKNIKIISVNNLHTKSYPVLIKFKSIYPTKTKANNENLIIGIFKILMKEKLRYIQSVNKINYDN